MLVKGVHGIVVGQSLGLKMLAFFASRFSLMCHKTMGTALAWTLFSHVLTLSQEVYQYHCVIIKSPQSGVTLCFQFVSAAATTFASHVKTVSAKPYIFGTKNLWVWGNVLNDLSMTLTQGHGCGIDNQNCACLRDKVRTTHRITTKHGSIIALVMVITWLDFGEVLLETVILANFLKKFGCVFSRSNTILAVSQEWLVRLMWNEKEMHQLDTGYNMWPWSLTSVMTLTLDVSRSNFDIALSQELLVWLMWNENEVS